MFKKAIVVLGLAITSVSLQVVAADFSASLGTQQAVGQHTGIVWGNTSSESKGNAIAAAQVTGIGSSSQWANSNTLGSSTFGGKIDNIGTTVFSGSMQDTKVNAGGTVTGNAQLMEGNSILNGSQAFGSTVSQAKADSNFEVKQYGSFHHDAAQFSYNGF